MGEKYVFGNLDDWGIVLEQLDKLSRNHEIGNYQDELIRLLRFDHNWRLREAAIETLPLIENPGLDIAREVASLITRKDLYYDVRILATDGLEKLAAAIVNNNTLDKETIKQFIREIVSKMDGLLASPEPPKFSDAIHHASAQFKEMEAQI